MAEAEAEAGEKKGKGKLIAIIAVLAVLLIGGSVGATLFFTGVLGGGEAEAEAEDEHAAEEEAHAEAYYFAIEPPITVNFQQRGRARFLQVSLQVMTHDPLGLEHLKQHMPVVRNNLNLLFSGQSYDELSTREGKELLRKQALAEIQNVLTARAGAPVVDEVYFTAFVMQ